MGSSRVCKLKWLRRRHVPVSMKSIIYTFSSIACLFSFEIAAGPQPAGPSTSADTNLVTGNNQKFLSTPRNQTTTLGSTVQLNCIVDHISGAVQWTRDGFGLGNLDGFERYSMPGNKTNGNFTLVIHPVTVEDDAEFQCQVSSSASHHALRSPFAKLNVEIKPKPPVIVYEHDSNLEPMAILYQQLYAKPGDIVTLKCVSTGGRPAPKIKWTDDLGKEINDGVTYASRVEGKCFNASSTLIFQAHEGMNNKRISCQAYSAPGPAENIMNYYSMGCHVMLNINHGDKSAAVVSENSAPSVVLWIGFGVAGILLILIFAFVAMIFRSNKNRESETAGNGGKEEAAVVSVNTASTSVAPHNVLDSSHHMETAEARNISNFDNYRSYPTPKTSTSLYKYSWDNSDHRNAAMGYNDNSSYYVAVEDTEV